MLVAVEELTDFELVFGLVSPIGTDVERVATLLESELALCRYDSEVVWLSHLLEETPVAPELPKHPSSPDYYERRMDAGDELRRQYGTGDALAGYAIAKMRKTRLQEQGSNDQGRRFAWILRTIKHPDEVGLLRATYGRRFLLIAINAPEETRRSRLRGELQDSAPGAGGLEARVAQLLERDELDASETFGQHVRDAYSLADYFIQLDDSTDLEAEVKRLIGLIFGQPFLTPTKDEVAMFLAYASSLRSADPGRQVGAVIATERGEVLALGTNEVPKAGGGEYWSDDPVDHRDFKQGFDFNRRETRRALHELLDALASNDHLSDAMTSLRGDERLAAALKEDKSGRLRESRALSLIEFGRIVHAEMSAITQAARSTISIRDATLYTTAYPCHMCMRLIIASGLSKVVYVDPYPKSLASDMYQTEIRQGGSGLDGENRLLVEPFWGAAWSIYAEVFSKINRRRGDDGAFLPWDRQAARMRLAESDPLVKADELEKQVPVALEEAEASGSDDAEAEVAEAAEGRSEEEDSSEEPGLHGSVSGSGNTDLMNHNTQEGSTS